MSVVFSRQNSSYPFNFRKTAPAPLAVMCQTRVSPLLWSPSERYVRFEEGVAGGAVGKGSYGRVYSSYDRLLQQHVMVKRQPLQHSALLERELLSFQTLRAFPHPNVVRMLDYFTGSREDRSPAGEPSSRRISSVLKCDEFFYMVFEACASDLYVAYMKNPLGRAGCKPIPELSKHFLDVARGVAHLHGLGLVHGDLSMSNILVGDDCRARVADLGTAHSCHTLLAGSNAFKGTSYARAPEIWMARGIQRKHRTHGQWASSRLS